MFDSLTEKLSSALRTISGKAKLSPANMASAITEIKHTLIDADVALSVIDEFTANVSAKAAGQKVAKKLSPSQHLIKVVKEELIAIMGGEQAVDLNLSTKPPAVILVAGLQGSGKTTSLAKLAKKLKDTQQKKVLVVSCDVYRPAAIEQLATLAKQIEVDFFPATSDMQPKVIAENALAHAKRNQYEVLLVDTAGRMHLDDAMMAEVADLQQLLTPIETLFVVDSMTGQDAANTALAFSKALNLTGVVLTKTDGDARGGAALSVRYLTGVPIKFMGVGEKVDAITPFHPERVVSRILGMGDVLSLIEDIQAKVDKEAQEKIAKKVGEGRGFDLEDYRSQLLEMMKLGGVNSMLDKLPGVGNMAKLAEGKIDDKTLARTVAIINSMTMKERKFPQLIRGNRKKRIAVGSGSDLAAVSRVLKTHQQMQKMMKKVGGKGKGGMTKMLRGLQGNLPSGFMN